MYELTITVTRVLGTCTADPPMKPGDFFTVRDGDIRIPEGGYICLYALQSLLPLIPPKEREILEEVTPIFPNATVARDLDHFQIRRDAPLVKVERERRQGRRNT